MRKTGFKLKANKCFIKNFIKFIKKNKFGYFKLKILGQIFNQYGNKPNEEGLVKNFPIQENKKQTRSFLGLCNFFRKFIS